MIIEKVFPLSEIRRERGGGAEREREREICLWLSSILTDESPSDVAGGNSWPRFSRNYSMVDY